MKSYEARYGHKTINISGETPKDAVEAHFDAIGKLACIGNAAGWALERVWMDFAHDRGYLHILAKGDDGLVSYDPTKDEPVETVVSIHGVKEGEANWPIEFELNEKAPFDPFSEDALLGKYSMIGVLAALWDRVAENHSAKRAAECPSAITMNRMPTAYKFKADLFLRHIREISLPSKPKDDQATKRLLARIAELEARIPEASDDGEMNYWICKAKTEFYFRKQGKITALAHYRKKAGKTQSEVAEEVGISLRQYQKYESVEDSHLGDAKYSVVVKIASAVGVEADDLVHYSSTRLVEKN